MIGALSNGLKFLVFIGIVGLFASALTFVFNALNLFSPEQLKVATLASSLVLFPVFFVAAKVFWDKLREMREHEKGFLKDYRGAGIAEIKILSAGCPRALSIPLVILSVGVLSSQIISDGFNEVRWSYGQDFTSLHVSAFSSTTFGLMSFAVIMLISHLNDYGR